MSLASLSNLDVAGRWRVYARPPGRVPVEITLVRGQPVALQDFSWEDPFGPKQAQLYFEQISGLDAWGAGDLFWLVPDVGIDIVWDGELPEQWPTGFWVPSTDPDDLAFEPGPLLPPRPGAEYGWRPVWRWEGYASLRGAAKKSGRAGLTLTVKGQMNALDGYLAKPEHPFRPLPYEWAIGRQFLGKPALRMSRMQVLWPSWWTKTFQPEPGLPQYRIPTGVQVGEKWTAYLTRDTGSFNPALRGYIQQMLASMYTERGRFTLDLMPGRVPLLTHRDIYSTSRAGFLVIDLASPGVEFDLSEDDDQTIGAVYGRARSTAGTSYSGQQVSADGQSTSYQPLAELKQVRESDVRGWLDPGKMRRETMLQVQEGITPAELKAVGEQHQRFFSDPGVVGTLELTAAVGMVKGDGSVERVHHLLLRAGMSAVLKGWHGRPETVVHVTDAQATMAGGAMQLTVDSKYRDALTVGQVRDRTRDALAVPRMMIAGQYEPPIPDALVPWNYAEGSGYFPSGPLYNSLHLFRDMPRHITFPWQEWTLQRPPKDPAWRHCYVGIAPAGATSGPYSASHTSRIGSNRNWAGVVDANGARLGFPVRLAQAGRIRLIQIAAYDRDGNVVPVEFHVSFYTNRGVNWQAMPMLSEADSVAIGKYAAGQRYPFHPNAWERFNTDGTATNPQIPHATETAGLIKAYGTYDERPGHFPNATSGAKTGLFVDEEGFEFDLTQVANAFDPYSPEGNWTNPLAGMVYAMVYCEDQGEDMVFFAGRLFRAEPGAD